MRVLFACVALFSYGKLAASRFYLRCPLLTVIARPVTFVDTLDSYWQQWTSDGSSTSSNARAEERPLLAQLLLAQRQLLLIDQQKKQLRGDGDMRQLHGNGPQLEPNGANKLWDDGNTASTFDLLSKLRPESSMLDLSTSDESRGLGVYFQVLPDEEYGEEPIYSIGGAVRGGEETTRLKYGFVPSPFG
uniref:Uncharacterized protein n=1 Tax=Plectus sambesii TaxID=2011161 RepID=A0A914WJZ1_9BILA